MLLKVGDGVSLFSYESIKRFPGVCEDGRCGWEHLTHPGWGEYCVYRDTPSVSKIFGDGLWHVVSVVLESGIFRLEDFFWHFHTDWVARVDSQGKESPSARCKHKDIRLLRQRVSA